ncbi:serine hydrolase [Streptomyces sp. NBC_01190]|uniref:serine hydrolase n=1 Tax=Streptomyces sp. NBC_01190 TaxID=2903767 RepID=UPI003867A620|nr:serine hydrolase [Streptomyces sp. NBC_01190]
MTTRPLPTGTPAAQGVDARGVEDFLDALEAAPGIEPHSLMIMRHGRLIAEGWWAPHTPDRKQLLYSLGKSLTSTAAGLAVADGLLDLDAPVVSYFPEFDAEITDPGSRAILVRHVASMATGHLAETHVRAVALDPREIVRGFLLLPPDRTPGTVFAYNQPATYSLGAIIQRVTGKTLTEYLRPRLLDPLGIGEVAWTQRPAGRDLAFSGLHATTDAIARLGQLYLQGGRWQGRQLLPTSWVAEATRSQVANSAGTPESAASDWEQGYGFQFWMSRHGYRGDGAYGQFCVVLPDHDAVIATTAQTELMQDLLNLMWEHLLPAFGPEPLHDVRQADPALRERLAGLRIPPLATVPDTSVDRDAWSGSTFTPEGGRCADQRTLTGATLTADASGWTLSLAEGDSTLDLRFGDDAWTVAESPVPTAVSAGWTDAGTLVASVRFLETPHHLLLTFSLPDRTFTAHWPCVPMPRGPLRSYQAPRR